MIRVLVVDDEEPFRRLLTKELGRRGFGVEAAPDGREALRMLKDRAHDVVLLDILMPGLDGLGVLQEISRDPFSPPIIMLTGQATVETAVAAMKHGAHDYLTKPYKLDELEIVVRRAAEFGRLSVRSRVLEQELLRGKSSGAGFVGSGKKMRAVMDLIRKIAPTGSTVLIQGESGTGKELAAGEIWRRSRRSNLPFIPLNCAALSENLMESELFGHEKGAFTTAHRMKFGIVEAADKGTLFLDEIAEMPVTLQAKLLRFMDSGEFRRVGGNRTLSVDVRVIAATNKDLSAQVARGVFREDLYYRLKVMTVTVPPLRDRREDIPELARFFAERFAGDIGRPAPEISAGAMDALASHAWPGNVRELANEIERAVILCEGDEISPGDLSAGLCLSARMAPASPGEKPPAAGLDEMEREHILRVLNDTGGNRTRASKILGIDRKTLYRKMLRYGFS